LKKIFLLLLLPLFLNACALCSLAIPKISANINFNITENRIKQLDISWVFSKSFTTQLLESYDSNANGKFDAIEMVQMNDILFSYVKPRNHLTYISTYTNGASENASKISFEAKNSSIFIKDEKLHFDFSLFMDLLLEKGKVFKVVFEDSEGFFDFRVVQREQFKIDNNLWVIPNINFHFAFYEITSQPTKIEKKKSLKELITPKKEQKKESYISFLENVLKEYTQKLKSLMSERDSFAKVFSLVIFSFLYGFFHALGPGHGKTLVGSYFLASGGNWIEAALMALRIGIIHVAGAFLLVMSSIYIIQTFISKMLNDVTLYTSYFSGILIVSISFWMLLKKLKPKAHESSCSCSSCATHSTKKHWAVAFAAGIVPCPGTVVIFLFTFVAGNYLIGFLSAISMALGMSFVIFISSIFGQLLNDKLTNKISILPSILEYIAIVFMLILGVTLILFPVSF